MRNKFYIGQKVICVCKFENPHLLCPIPLVVYTVKEVTNHENKPGIVLQEIRNRKHFSGFEPAFEQRGFDAIEETTIPFSAFLQRELSLN